MNRTLRGIGIRAAVLIIGIALVAVWLVSLAMEIAGAFIHLLLILGLVLTVAAVGSHLVRRWKRRR